jgi:hypothetical protein
LDSRSCLCVRGGDERRHNSFMKPIPPSPTYDASAR